jgi:hypothetical protein
VFIVDADGSSGVINSYAKSALRSTLNAKIDMFAAWIILPATHLPVKGKFLICTSLKPMFNVIN